MNGLLKKRVEELFESREELELFIRISSFGLLNFRMPAMGGKIFYKDIAEQFGWKLQQYKILGLKSHYRLLAQSSRGRAWMLNPQVLLMALDDYKAAKRFYACYKKQQNL